MSRIPRLRPDQLDERQRAVYDAITGGPRADGPRLFPLTAVDGSLHGPFNAMLLHPPFGDALQRLGGAIRYEGTLPARSRELAILVVAAHWRSGFERYAHERVGEHAGLTDAEMRAVHEGFEPALTDPDEAAVVRLTHALVARSDLTEDEYAAAAEALGPETVFELTTLVGYYSMLALQLRVFGVD